MNQKMNYKKAREGNCNKERNRKRNRDKYSN